MPPLPAHVWERFDAQNPMARPRRSLDGASLLILMLVASWQWLAADGRSLGSFATRCAMLSVAWWFSVLWHELGHAALVRAAGLDPYAILLGSGRSVVRTSFCGITLDCGWFPGAGLTMFGPLRGDHLRARTVAAFAGGPAATMLLLVVAGCFALRMCGPCNPGPLEPLRALLAGHGAAAPTPLGLSASALVVSNSLVLLTTLRLRVGQAEPASVPSDLATVTGLLFRRTADPVAIEGWSRQRDFARCLALRKYDEAERLALAILHAEPGRSRLRLDLANMLLLTRRYDEAAFQFQELLEPNSGHQEAQHAAWLTPAAIDYARTCLLLGGAARLAVAERWSANAMTTALRYPRLLITRSAVLAERGELGAAQQLLDSAHWVKAIPKLEAERCAVQALIAVRRGEHAVATTWFARTRLLDPDCELLPLAER